MSIHTDQATADSGPLATPLILPPNIDTAALVGQWARGGRIEAT